MSAYEYAGFDLNPETHTYELITLDVWGNTRDGYEVNDLFRTGVYVDLPDNASDYLINRRLGGRGITWDGDPEFQLFGESKRNGRPIAQLRRIDPEDNPNG